MVFKAWLRTSVVLPVAYLLFLLCIGNLIVHDNPRLFFTIFGTGDPLLIGFLILAGVVDDADLHIMGKKNLSSQIKQISDLRDFLQISSFAALLGSFVAKLFTLSEHEVESHLEDLVPLMNVALAGLLFCASAAIWLKRGLLKQI
jgi:hypothetical protein